MMLQEEEEVEEEKDQDNKKVNNNKLQFNKHQPKQQLDKISFKNDVYITSI
jgi:hypothetical protein